MGSAAELLACEQEAWKALCTSGPTLLPMLADDVIMLFPGGMLLTNESNPTLKSTLTSEMFTPWKKYIIEDSYVRLLDCHGASGVICYKVTAEKELEQKERSEARETVVFNALCSSTWRKTEEGAWKMRDGQLDELP
ncbi:hypothetical protein APSETT444_002576 [Aspergillus pseudonomiae]